MKHEDDIRDGVEAAADGSGERRVRRRDTDLAETGSKKPGRRERRAAEKGPGDTPEAAGDEQVAGVNEKKRKQRRRKAEPGEEGAILVGSVRVEDETAGDGSPRQRGKVSGAVASMLSGDVLSKKEVRKAYPYMIFVVILAFFYIYNVFRTQSIYREHTKLSEQVVELRAKSMTIASERMRATRQSRIMEELDRRGIPLKESLVPNKVIPKPVTPQQTAQDGPQEVDR